MSRIISIGKAVPPFGARQEKILEFMKSAYQDDSVSRKLSVLFSRSGIEMRYSAVPDFMNAGQYKLFEHGQDTPGIAKRTEIFRESALELSIQAIHQSVEKLNTTVQAFDFTHIIAVTCTGIYAPGIETDLIESLHLRRDISRNGIFFLGCNAAFFALKTADLICEKERTARVLVVCVELCTLHFQPKDNNDNLLANTIFGDGAAAVIVVSQDFAARHDYKGLDIQGFYSMLFRKAKHLMSWNLTPVNYEMVLDAKLPDFIGNVLPEVYKNAIARMGIEEDIIDYWAVHPGGKKILDLFRKTLELEDENLSPSYNVLKDYGNMSSCTFLFVLEEIITSLAMAGEHVFGIGFGPGLSIDTALFKYA